MQLISRSFLCLFFFTLVALSSCGGSSDTDTPKDSDGDGYTVAAGDCNDSDAAISPDAVDIPDNGVDENCDGADATQETSSPDDVDGDGFTEAEGDCDDTNSDINPDAEGIANNGIDENCDGQDPIIAPDFSVRILSPASLATVGVSALPITGTVDGEDVVLTVNGLPIETNNDGSFSVNVALEEGHNSIVVRGVKGAQSVSDSISVSLDLTPPYVTIDSHHDGEIVFSDVISVTGLINDIVRGTIEANQAGVTVNGREANISNRSYSALNVPLEEGSNTISVVGVDQVGNVGSASITVNYSIPIGKQIELVSGQDQAVEINGQLSAPFVVKVLDDNKNPVPGSPVVFRVDQGAGAVGIGTENEGRAVVVESDENGLAQTLFKVGSRVGVSNHKVRAKVVGYDDEAVFTASAIGKVGNKISVNSGNNQRGAAGQVLSEALVVVVTDDGANAVAGSRVQFQITKGTGELLGVGSTVGSNIFDAVTDGDGRASVEWRLGFLEGLDAQRVSAVLIDAPTDDQDNVLFISAGFAASAFISADPGLTSISGVILDNQNTPIPGVTVRIDGAQRQAVSDAQGQFTITEAHVGPVHLIADGSTATVDGEFPSLSYNIVTIAGVDNPLATPIYMVKLDTDNTVLAGPEDVALTLDKYPGFKLSIAKDSVTFPDGSREGLISVTSVNASSVPMAPPNGMQPQFIVTIQPTGTRFDPPASLALPNVDAHAPGAQVEMYSFDHDLEEFVTIGLGTVSEDGSVVESNLGVGVVKAGWHCGSQPGGSGCVQNCNVCQECNEACNCVAAFKPNTLLKGSVPDVLLKGLEPDVPGDCKSTVCGVDGSPEVIDDDTDILPEDAICKQCTSGELVNKPDTDIGKTYEPLVGPELKEVTYLPSVHFGGTNTGMALDYSGVKCTQICADGLPTEKWLLEGDLTYKDSWEVKVATKIRLRGCRRDAKRTDERIAATRVHETLHRDQFMSVLNGARSQLGGTYVNEAVCNADRFKIINQLVQDWNKEILAQDNHTGPEFDGEDIWVLACFSGVTFEIRCIDLDGLEKCIKDTY